MDINHVRNSVFLHRFTNASDWADALSELADMNDREITEVATGVIDCTDNRAWNC